MDTDPLSRTFSALAHPARRAILARLGQGEATVQQLSRPLTMSAPAVSKHLKVLESSGLICRSRDAQWRPCQLRAEPLLQASLWMEQYRLQWEARLDRLEAYLQTLDQQALSPTAAAIAEDDLP